MRIASSKVAILIAFLAAISLFALTHFPLTDEMRTRIQRFDKFLHGIAFCLLSVCVAWAVSTIVKGRFRQLLIASIGLVGFALIDELLQAITPTRTADVRDWLADCLGIVAGLAIFYFGGLIRREGRGPKTTP